MIRLSAHRWMTVLASLASLAAAAKAQKLSDYPAAVAQTAELIRVARQDEPQAWKRIPWVDSLTKARQISRQEQRPLFLFAHIGNMGMGRC